MFQNVSLSLLQRFSTDRKGVAALEYALIAPMMFMLLFVSFELTDALSASNRAERAAGAIADVIARDVLVSDAEVADVLAAVPWITHPTPGEHVRSRITSIFVNASGQASVVWSEGSGMAALPVGAIVTLPGGMLVPETGLIMGETQMDYRPPLGLYSASAFTINKTEYRRSRIMDPIERFAG